MAERSWRGGPNCVLISRNSRLSRPEPAKRLIREQDDSNIIMEESIDGVVLLAIKFIANQIVFSPYQALLSSAVDVMLLMSVDSRK